MDEIRIKQLEVFAHHGVFPEENRLGTEICHQRGTAPPSAHSRD